MEQELITLPVHLSSRPVFSGVRVTRSLVLYVCFVDRCLSFCTFSFDHCVVGSSSIYGFWLPLWYLQTLLNLLHNVTRLLFRTCKQNSNVTVISSEYKCFDSVLTLYTDKLRKRAKYLPFYILHGIIMERKMDVEPSVLILNLNAFCWLKLSNQ